MADDGMLMNFSVGSDPLQIKSVFKGGRWRDRLQAKKSSKRRHQKDQPNSTLTGSNAVPTKPRETAAENADSRPAKKQKLNGSSHPPPTTHNIPSKPKEVVSSLFTSNPTSKPAPPTPAQPTEDPPAPSPSNAPLPATTSPFTSLGLSPFLSTHLTHSLHLTSPTSIQKAAITKLLHEDSDAFIQAETGSGKTLAYLLPIIQRIIALSTPTAKINRKSGLFALILAPTRELTHQISAVLTRLLSPLPHLVAGTVTGGSTKNHEKSKLRKGLNILVATPGRLADHLEHTEVLDVSNVRWLVLDEGDRLMELGFEEEIKAILKKLDDRKRERKGDGVATQSVEGLPEQRTTVLCSATMKMGVQKLGEISLKDAVHIKAEPAISSESTDATDKSPKDAEKQEKAFLAPAQLRQSYIVTPPKQRLVTLAALLKHTFVRKGSVMKAIVFVSCADSVDFHFEVFARKEEQPPKESNDSERTSRTSKKHHKHEPADPSSPVEEMSKSLSAKKDKLDLLSIAPASILASTMNPDLMLYKLHGSLEQKLRTATLQSFTKSPDPAILLCTDVASRGLDLPNIDLVIEFDPAFSADDHLHRVGRTARAGKEGRSCCFLMPGAEEGYVKVLKECAGESVVKSEGSEDVLRKGFVGSKSAVNGSGKWDDKATDWQLEVERWVIDDRRAAEMGRKAFISHVRAYTTHISKERVMFDVKDLHLGHLAKAFALRDKPGSMGRGNTVGNEKRSSGRSRVEKRTGTDAGNAGEETEGHRPSKADFDLPASDGRDAARKMRAKMKEHMAGANEFNIG